MNAEMQKQIAERIIAALDLSSRDEIDKLLKSLKGDLKFVKVGMELFYSEGPDIVKYLKDQDLKVFLDLKLHDIPTTVFKAMKNIAALGADIINVHALGGVEMMKAARGALIESFGDIDIAHSGRPSSTRPFLIGVTQLTSTDKEVMNNELGIPGEPLDSVLNLAKNAKQAGLDGVVCSAQEVQRLKEELGESFIAVTPGIRLPDESAGDQKRVLSPREAIELGVDYMVIGRTITKSADPKKAFQLIMENILVCKRV